MPLSTGPNGVGMTHLGMLSSGSFNTASGINDAGRVVGSSDTVLTFSLGFITGPNGVGKSVLDFGMLARGTFSGGQRTSMTPGRRWGPPPRAICFVNAFITGPNGVGITNLGTLGG